MRRRRLVPACAVLAALLAGAPPALGGPEEEPDPSFFDIDYPGAFTVDAQAPRQRVARVGFENTGGSDSAGLDVCVILPRGFRDASVDGKRRRVRVTRGGAKICWFAGAISPGERKRALVRATAPRRTGSFETRVKLIAVEDTFSPGESLTRRGDVRVRR